MAEKKTQKEELKDWAEDFSVSKYLEGSGPGIRQNWPGLCGKCSNLAVVKDETGEVVRAVCRDSAFESGDGYPMRLDSRRPVSQCTEFWPVNQPSLAEMIDNAKIIQVFKEQGGHYL